VNGRRVLICAILVYVALDFSLPSMRGAFVFDPTDSVESVHAKRDASAALPVALLRNGYALARPGSDEMCVAVPAPWARPRPCHVRARHVPRAALDSPPSAEDPH
jgi:hypothetical protein